MQRILLFIILATILIACNNEFKPINDHEFLEMDSYGLYTKVSSTRYIYEDDNSQIAFNKERRTIRFQKDDQSSYIHIQELKTASESQSYMLNIRKFSDNITTSTVYEMISVKSDSTKIWLWSEEDNTGLILPASF